MNVVEILTTFSLVQNQQMQRVTTSSHHFLQHANEILGILDLCAHGRETLFRIGDHKRLIFSMLVPVTNGCALRILERPPFALIQQLPPSRLLLIIFLLLPLLPPLLPLLLLLPACQVSN